MTALAEISRALSGVQYMGEAQAKVMREHILSHDLSEILEIGFYKGKSSAYFAAILEERAKGHLITIDMTSAERHKPGIYENLEAVGLSHRVTPIFAERYHTWELAKMIRQSPRPQFDMCYFDGGHTWDVTGFGFCLVDLLLKPGGWIIFDDLDWTIARSVAAHPERAKSYASYSEEEKSTPGVRMVFETLLPERGYDTRYEKGSWGFARKPG